MIRGYGIDIQHLDAINRAMTRHGNFVDRVLTPEEKTVFEALGQRRQLTFLAGRWAAKEALSKALGTGIGTSLSFQDISVLPDDKGAPIMTCKTLSDNVFVSISHSEDYVVASVIVEEKL